MSKWGLACNFLRAPTPPLPDRAGPSCTPLRDFVATFFRKSILDLIFSDFGGPRPPKMEPKWNKNGTEMVLFFRIEFEGSSGSLF